MRRANRRRRRLERGVVVILDVRTERKAEEIHRPGKLVAVAEWRKEMGVRNESL
ncbi:hypothetical protein DNHGIG_25590 [Collibacillus ludicampi]|uniref:Uncharacterized protein n=1 Tax=Collibacillus ludicampi TaxID=2771369 RepID=A0AAV4LGV1_9BACL|nr:hypothetical protein DNHGIG_25590 [Collibacillus ludicampi]